MDAGVFRPLDWRMREARMLDLEPGKGDDEIVCHHEVVSLHDHHAYDAVSLTQCDEPRTHNIRLNGRDHPVSAILYSGLRDLRYPGEVRRLWVEALCVNKADLEEKRYQVIDAGPLYKNASCVLVYLGPATPDTDLGLDIIESIADKPFVLRDGRHEVNTMLINEENVRAVLSLLHRPFWDRMWVVLEVVVAGTDVRVCCGPRHVPWRTLGRPLAQIRETLDSLREGTILTDEQGLWDMLGWGELTQKYDDMDAARRFVLSHEAGAAPPPGPTQSNIMDLMRLCTTKKAAEPRDFIFCLFPLVKIKARRTGKEVAMDLLEPDYAQGLDVVYSKACDAVLFIEDDLSVLSLRNHPASTQGLPSWVPDFGIHRTSRFPSFGPRSMWPQRRRSKTHSRMSANSRLSDDCLTLFAKGWRVDSVQSTVELTGIRDDTAGVIRQVHKQTALMLGPDGGGGASFYVTDAILRTLVGNSINGAAPCPRAHRRAYLEIVDEDAERADPQRRKELLEAVCDSVCYATDSPHRKLAITNSGMLGLASSDCRVGDLVCELVDYRLPVLLREAVGGYSFVGDAYVHGMVDSSPGGSEEMELKIM